MTAGGADLTAGYGHARCIDDTDDGARHDSAGRRQQRDLVTDLGYIANRSGVA